MSDQPDILVVNKLQKKTVVIDVATPTYTSIKGWRRNKKRQARLYETVSFKSPWAWAWLCVKDITLNTDFCLESILLWTLFAFI